MKRKETCDKCGNKFPAPPKRQQKIVDGMVYIMCPMCWTANLRNPNNFEKFLSAAIKRNSKGKMKRTKHNSKPPGRVRGSLAEEKNYAAAGKGTAYFT